VIAAVWWPSGDVRAAVPWTWPVTGAIVRGFDPPDDPYGAGHRGIDIAAAVGTVVLAPDDGVVTFAGKVGGRLFLTIDHGRGISSTCSWLTSVLVRKNDRVARGQPVATTGWGHPEMPMPQLHFGVRLNGTYVDPIAFLGPLSVTGLIRLAPLGGNNTAALAASALGRMTGLAYPPSRSGRVLARDRGPVNAGVRGHDVGRSVAAVPSVGHPRWGRGGGARAPVPRGLVRPDGHR
jgi:murein DD-endopeptidase MepM/ murein hydrolase activator NlpD